jgi:hypothetical protein
MSTLRSQFLLLGGLLVVAFIAGLISAKTQNGLFHSVEVTFTESSPKGAAGGAVVPASCSSYAHVAGECGAPTFSCSDNSVRVGAEVTCTWSCAPGSTSSAGGNFSTGGATSGSANVTVGGSTTYSVQCAPVGMQTSYAVEAVDVSLSLSATPTRVRSGSASSLSWTASSVTSCTLKKGATTLASCPSGGSCATNHTTSSGALTAQSIFTLTCQSEVGPATASATVFITPSVCEVGTEDCPN